MRNLPHRSKTVFLKKRTGSTITFVYFSRNKLMDIPEMIVCIPMRERTMAITALPNSSIEPKPLACHFRRTCRPIIAPIARKAKPGAVFMVYGMEKILPRLEGMELIGPGPLEGVLALYQKI